MTSDLTHELASGLPRDVVRGMLASTPPPPPALWATAGEDEAIRALREHGYLTLPRFDATDATSETGARRSNSLPPVHLGAIRLFDRGIIRLATDAEIPDPEIPGPVTDTHATWVWNGHHGESKGLRMQRWRTLSYLPYQVGHYGLTPEYDMSGPLMAAVLAWHHAHTGVVRLDVHLNPTITQPTPQTYSRLTPASGHDWTLTVTEHHRDGTTRTRTIPAATTLLPVEVARYDFDHDDADDFALALRRNAHPHRQPGPEDGLHPAHEARLLHALCSRIAPTLFDGDTAITVDLITWLLHPHTPASTPDSRPASRLVPLDVQDALTVLGAPTLTLDHPDMAHRWATTQSRVTFTCRGTNDGETTWKHRHLLQITATGGVALIPARDKTVQRRCDTDHLLAALTGHPTTCVTLARVLDGTDPASIRGTLTRLRMISPATADRLEAAYRIARWLRTPDEHRLPEHRR